MDPLKNPSYLRPEVLQQQTLHSPDRPLRNSGFFRTEVQCPPDSLKQVMKVKASKSQTGAGMAAR